MFYWLLSIIKTTEQCFCCLKLMNFCKGFLLQAISPCAFDVFIFCFYFCAAVDVQVDDYTYNQQLEGECWSYVFCSPHLFLVIGLIYNWLFVRFLLLIDLCNLLFIYYGVVRSYAYPSMIFCTVYGVIIYEALVSAVNVFVWMFLGNRSVRRWSLDGMGGHSS